MSAGWKVGDRAMCIDDRWLGDEHLEVGRVYRVTGVLNDGAGLTLAEFTPPEGYRGVRSSRFHRIPEGMTYKQSVEGLL